MWQPHCSEGTINLVLRIIKNSLLILCKFQFINTSKFSKRVIPKIYKYIQVFEACFSEHLFVMHNLRKNKSKKLKLKCCFLTLTFITFQNVVLTSLGTQCACITKKNRLELFGEIFTVYYWNNRKQIIYSAGKRHKFLISNVPVHTARTQPEGFEIGVSEIIVELRYVRNVMFVIYWWTDQLQHSKHVSNIQTMPGNNAVDTFCEIVWTECVCVCVCVSDGK